jgi:hypothetical protein
VIRSRQNSPRATTYLSWIKASSKPTSRLNFSPSFWKDCGNCRKESHFASIVYLPIHNIIMSDGAGKRKQGPGGNGPAFKKSKVSTKDEPLFELKTFNQVLEAVEWLP